MTGDAIGSLIPGAVNFRDIGGLPAGDGATRRGVLYRSGNLAHLEREGVDALRALGVRRIIDLRADEEVDHAPSRVDGLGIETVRVPLFLGSVASFFERDISLSEMYRALVDDSASRVLEVIRGLLADQPVLVHCTVGKDRTGVTVALALAAAGVDEDAVIADYARTEGMLPGWRNRDIVRMLEKHHPEAVNLEELATRSPARVMRGLLDDLTVRYGSPTAYLRAGGLREDEIAELRRVLVAET
jgi:protein-tyrosine phosphatase